MTLIGALSNAATALQATQSALGALSNNVANVNTPGYARKVPELAPRTFAPNVGGGVDVSSVKRLVDRYLQADADRASAASVYAQTYQTFADAIDTALGQLGGGQDLATQLSKLRDSLIAATASPADPSFKRNIAIAADGVARTVRSLSLSVNDVRAEAQRELETAIVDANSAMKRVARLNQMIATGLGIGQDVGLLQDQRAKEIQVLVGLLGARTVDNPDGSVDVFVGPSERVIDATGHPLAVSSPGNPEAAVILDGRDVTASLDAGRIGALLDARDGLASDTTRSLDALSVSLIESINAVYADAAGPVGRSSIQGGVPIASADRFSFGGTIKFMTVDSSGRVVSSYDCVGGVNETLDQFVARFNLDNAAASVVDRRLHLETTDPSRQLTLAWGAVTPGSVVTSVDTGKSLIDFLGLNEFLTGTNSSNLAVRSDIVAQPSLFTTAHFSQEAVDAGVGARAFAPGDPTTLTKLAAVLEVPIDLDIIQDGAISVRRASLIDHANDLVGRLSTAVGAATSNTKQAQALDDAMMSRLSSANGVSLDQEMAELMKYQNAYSAAAHVLSVVNEMLQQLEQAVV